MVIHKITPFQRQTINSVYYKEKLTIASLSRAYNVTRQTIYKIIHRGRLKDFSVNKSTN